ncbi:MAG: hypothetical protein Q8928_19345 [Bacteroidota bacterium]|nr:hypothetical protein [Bacteroidota bacterium]
MIFKDKIEYWGKILHPEFVRLLDFALKNQSHIGDLLLFHVNGFYQELLDDFTSVEGRKLNPHVIGPGMDGHSEQTHYDFIDQYRQTNIAASLFSEYSEQIKFNPERQKEIDELVYFESTTIQIEMLIYLKIWEADLTIKKMYEFVRILNGEPYDWYFKVAESSRDKNCTGTRQDIIRLLIRDKVKTISPVLYDWIKDSYKTQIRNSIAHSNYAIFGRNISLNNFIANDPASQMTSLEFNDWTDIFHKTLVLHNELIWLSNTINDVYGSKALENYPIHISVTELLGKKYSFELEYRQEYKDWKYKKK